MMATTSNAEASMKSMESEVTPQGQVAVPASIRAKLGLVYSSRDIHDALFAPPASPPGPRTLEEMDAGVRALMQRKHARR